MLEIGSLIDGKYKILSKIGQGGMSVVYLALNEKANKSWAIKEVRKDGVKNFEIIKQGLVAETDILKKLNHKSLPSIVDIIENDDNFLIVMDYIEGNPLSNYIEEYGAQPQEDVIRWGMELCDVLGYLHSRVPPIIYRDMKPSNIMLRPDKSLVLIDFGTAREFKRERVEDTVCLGTQGYAAPEQFGGHGQTDARTDIYCLGATLYHLLTNHNPAEPPYEIYPIRKWNPELSSGLEKIILKCTKRDPDERYQNCNELYYALEHYNELDNKYRKKQLRRLRLFIAAVVLCFISGATALFGKLKENSLTEQTYDRFIKDAVMEEQLDDRIDSYMSAIELDPSRSDAFDSILNLYLEDGVYNEEEDKKMRSILSDLDEDGVTYEERFSENRIGYSHFAYNMGMAYWYSYGFVNEDTKEISYTREYNIATRWFEKVESNSENIKEFSNAEIYGKIGLYYSQLGKVNKAGDSEISYTTYWEDLITLYNNDSTNQITRLYLDKEIIYQIVNSSSHYKEEGMDKEKLLTMIEDVSTEVSKVQIDENNRALYEELISDINDYIVTAKKTVSAVYD